MPEMTSATGPAIGLADGRVPAGMTPARRRWTLALAGLGAFMSALDVVVATALPTMRTQLGASLADLEWTINAYNVAALSASRLRESRGPRPQLEHRRAGPGRGRAAGADLGGGTRPHGGLDQRGGDRRAGRRVMLMLAFVAWERRARYPMLPLAYFRRRGSATANGVIFFQFISLIGSLFFITQLFQVGLGYSPLGAGLRILVWMDGHADAGGAGGRRARRPGWQPAVHVLGAGLAGRGTGLAGRRGQAGVGHGTLVAPLIVAGVGIAMCFPTVANAVTASVPPGDVGVAAGTNNALNALGGVFGRPSTGRGASVSHLREDVAAADLVLPADGDRRTRGDQPGSFGIRLLTAGSAGCGWIRRRTAGSPVMVRPRSSA